MADNAKMDNTTTPAVHPVQSEQQQSAERAAFQDRVYDALAKFNATAEWDVLKFAQMRQHLAEHLTDALLPTAASADEQPVEAYPAETDFSIEIHDAGRQWLPVGYRRPTLDEARQVRDARRSTAPGARFRIVEWTAAARVVETDEVPAGAEAATA